ncbi:MAG TPA: hypothetical protein VK789_06960 [Bryobacteraceae bacterium]|nr:hypothetical protein [Bryobacteraceae bacterium]
MKYVKSIGMGLFAVAAVILVAVAGFFAWLEFFSDPTVGVVVAGGRPIAVIAALAFAIGFFWEFYRLSRTESPARR